jgi:2-dehydropantoate 2-reductase
MNTSAPEPKLKRIAIVGMGAIGGAFAAWLGSRLPARQVQLSALARGDTLQQLRAQGLVWTDDQGTEHVLPPQALHASDQAAELGPQDLIVVAVKGPALAAVAPAVQAMLAPHTTVLVAMNGLPWWFFHGLPGECQNMALTSVDPQGLIAQAIPAQQVLGGVVHFSATQPGPGRLGPVRNNQLIVGEPSGGASPRAQAVATLLTQAGFAVAVSECIQRDIWFKLWGNMTMNPISALTGATCDRILDDPLVRGFCSHVMQEAQAIGQHIGLGIDQSPEDRHAITRKLGAIKTSMLQDVEAHRPLELDTLVGAVREVGQQLGVSTPHTDALLGLTRLMGQTRGLY